MLDNLHIRPLVEDDCERIAKAFAAQGWDKPAAQFERYLEENRDGKRMVLVAEHDGDIAGYVTIALESDYPHFKERNIPEIKDLNVLKTFQRRGIGGAVMDMAEAFVLEDSTLVGIGFGLTEDYGPAQRMYIKRGYIPDGHGVHHGKKPIRHGEHIKVDDNLALYLTKKLTPKHDAEQIVRDKMARDPEFLKRLKKIQDALESL